jgi:biotin transport system substrate-specific component
VRFAAGLRAKGRSNLQTTDFSRNLRIWKKRSFFGQLVVTLLSLELLFFASFVSLSLPTPTYSNLGRWMHVAEVDFVNRLPQNWQTRIVEKFPVWREPCENVRYSSYVPLMPLAIAIAYVIGFPLALVACCLHFLLGILGAPHGLFLFSGGGGTGYWREPGFGYLLGIIGGAWFAAWINLPDERKSWRQLLGAGGGVFITHLIGLSFVFFGSISVLLFEGEASYLHFQPFLAEQLRNLSWYTMPYDFLFAAILVALSFPLRLLGNILMSPDISHRHRPSVEAQLEVLQDTTA